MSETIHKAADETYIRIIPADTSSPAGKLADAEVYCTDQASGILAGLKITGFAIWAPRSPNAGRNVTMPARTWITGRGERRTFAIVRPAKDGDPTHAIAAIADSIREAYQAHERAEEASYQAEIDARRKAREASERPVTPSDFAVVAEVFGRHQAPEVEDEEADRMRGAVNHEADREMEQREAARRAQADRISAMTEDQARIELGRLAAQQPGGIALTDLMPGGKYGRTPAVRQTIADTQNAAARFEF